MLKRLKGNIREIIVVLIILVCVVVVIGSISIHEVELIREKQKYNVLASDIKEGIRDFDLKNSSEYQGLVIVAENLIPDSKEETIINNNTIYLQACIDEVSNSGGGIVRIPAGNFYFKKAEGKGREGVSYCVIECRDNVIVEGAGTDERTGTILRPYAPNSDLAVDMFFFNEIAISRNPVFLKNADFRNFIIDGNEAHCEVYSSAGKGFMINLFEDCDWENVVVKNTDGTGFGVDCPINCTIKDCIAINCGKAASENNVGASGFGIGTGYSNEESMIISNCIAIGNKKYGFFFEHQGRFYNREYNPYTATKSEGFVVSNCTASGNLYDFGGARANDVTYQNCISKVNMENDRTLSSIYFESNSVRNHIVNCKVEKKFTDVLDNSVYYNSVNWAVNNGITEGVSKTEFGIEQNCTRIQAIIFLFRLANRPGDVVFYSGIGSNTLSDDFTTGYTDIDGIKIFEGYLDAIKWAKNEGIIDNSSTMFFPNNDCTRADFITWLWKCAGKPVVQTGNNFEDVPAGAYYEDAVDWAVNQGIANGTSLTTFSPDELCARGQVVIFLNRFVNTKNKYSIKYNLDGGIAATNPVSYNSGVDTFIINNPSKEGYTFEGWTGSNYSEYVESNYIPQKTVQVTTSDVGNKIYTANYIANNYIVSFNANGGTGSMEDEYFTYDAVPQMLLKNSFTRRGYVFKGWNTKSNGTGDSYADAEFVENLTEVSNGKITLYAQWAHEEHIEVTDKEEEATCTESGLTEGKHCEVCKEIIVEQKTIPAKGHKEVIDAGIEATCTESGLTEGKHCEVCKEVTVEQKTIPAKGHKEVIDRGIEATCTESGLTEGKHCEVCKEVTVEQKTIPAKGHKEVIDRGIEATCTEAGKTEGKHCEVCKEVIVEQKTIPAKGHKEIIDRGIEATCTESGLTEGKHCEVCKEVTVEQKIIPAKGHKEVIDRGIEATCTEAGKTEGKYCEVCKEVIVEQKTIPAKGHKEVIDRGIEATCTESGLTEGKHCEVCKEVTVEQKTIPAKGHKEVIDAGIEATCTESGLTEGKHCEVCKKIIVEQKTIPAKGHKEVIDAGIEATCTEAGKTEGKHCEVCNEVLVAQTEIPAKGHKEIIDRGIEATCTEAGKTEGKHCEVCKEVIVEQRVIQELGHKFENAECTRCGEKEPKITLISKIYEIGEKYITKIKSKTKVKDLKGKIETNAKEIKIYSKENLEVKDEEIIGTGMQVHLRRENEKKTLILVIAGDVNGDGEVKVSDMTILNRYRLNKRSLEEESIMAGDVTADGKVDFKDIVKINRYRLNKITDL